MQAFIALLCVATICIIPLLELQDGIAGFKQWQYLSEHGIDTEGTVLEVEDPPGGRGLWEVKYQYQTKNEQGEVIDSFVVLKQVTGSFAASLSVGQIVPVQYDPVQPSVSRLRDDYQFVLDLNFIPGVIVLGVFGLTIRHLVRRARS